MMRFSAVALAVSALVLFSSASRADAASIKWVPVGPSGSQIGSGKLNAFAFVQSNTNIMYIGGGWGNTPRESPSQMGIYRTTDRGAHWTPIDNGLTNPDGTISSVVNGLWLDQNNPSIVLASTEFGGTFRSVDGGDTWVNVDRSESTQFAQSGSTIYLASSRGVLASVDDGATWSVSLSDSTGATTVVNSGTVTYAGTMGGDVYKLKGSTWTKTGHPGTGPIHNFAVDPFNTKIVYANVDDAVAWNQDLYASLDAGVTWKRVNCNCSIGPQAIAASAVVHDRIYMGDDGSGTIFYFTMDGNQSPTLHFGAQPFGVDMRYIVVASSGSQTDDACYLLEDQGLFYAAHCTTGTAPGLADQVQDTLAYDVKIAANGNNAIVPLQDNSAASSTNGGTSWFYSNAANGGEGGEAALSPVNPNLCTFAHPDSGLWVSTNACSTFNETVGAGFASVTFDPSNATKLYGITNADISTAHVQVSTNSGSSWANVSWQSFSNPYQVAVSPNDANTILVATGATTSAPHLFYSHDGGSSFTESTGLPKRAAGPNSTIYFPVDRFFVAFEPGVAGTILLVDHDPSTDNVLIYRSVDNGVSFTRVKKFNQPVPSRPWPNLAFPTSHERAAREVPYYATRFFGNRLAFNPQAPTGTTPAVIVTTRFGAWISYDVGDSWKRIDQSAIAHHFVGISWNGGYAFLASFGQGAIRSKNPLQ